jgi:hypothetical protein
VVKKVRERLDEKATDQRDDLKLKPYKKQKIHGLTEAQKANNSKKKIRQLLASCAGDNIIFSDNKLFLLQETYNQQNDRAYAVLLIDIIREKFAV